MENFPFARNFKSRNSAFVEKGGGTVFQISVSNGQSAYLQVHERSDIQSVKSNWQIDRVDYLNYGKLDMERRNPKLEEKTIEIREVGKISIVAW